MSRRGGRVRSSKEPCMPPQARHCVLRMMTRNELKRIQVGASMNAPNAPTLAEMEMKTYVVGGSEEVQSVGGSPNVAVEVNSY
ncbi:unnamed protein product [Sphagnum tenellum]